MASSHQGRVVWKDGQGSRRSPQSNRELRAKVIAHLGGKCVRCGFDDERALQIDHVNGGGNLERKLTGPLHNSSKFYNAVLEDTEGKYQLLCANCNWIKRHENHECKGPRCTIW